MGINVMPSSEVTIQIEKFQPQSIAESAIIIQSFPRKCYKS